MSVNYFIFSFFSSWIWTPSTTKQNKVLSTAEHNTTCMPHLLSFFSIWVISSFRADQSVEGLQFASLLILFGHPVIVGCSIELLNALFSLFLFSVEARQVDIHVSPTTSRPLTHAEWKLNWVAITLYGDMVTPFCSQLKWILLQYYRDAACCAFTMCWSCRRVLAMKIASS